MNPFHWPDQLKRFEDKHDPIAHQLASGAGIDLMYVDSQITEELISTFTRHYKCSILTVHDSYIVPFGYDHFLRQEMQAAFGKVTRISGSAVDHTTEYFDTTEQEPHPDVPPSKYEHYAAPASKRHVNELGLFREFKGKPEQEPWVADWTYVY